jgi:hypothetical protein
VFHCSAVAAPRQLRPLLGSSKWETRVAASEAVAALSERTPHPTATLTDDADAAGARRVGVRVLRSQRARVHGVHMRACVRAWHIACDAAAPATPTVAGPSTGGAPTDGMLSFAAFDVARVLEHGAPLLASGGQARAHAARTDAHGCTRARTHPQRAATLADALAPALLSPSLRAGV